MFVCYIKKITKSDLEKYRENPRQELILLASLGPQGHTLSPLLGQLSSLPAVHPHCIS